MSSNFSSPSTAMTAPALFLFGYRLRRRPDHPARELCKHRAITVARTRGDSHMSLESTLFFPSCGWRSAHHVRASDAPDSATVGLGQWPNHEQVPGPCLTSRPLTQRQASTPLRSEEHTSELQSRLHLVCRLLLEKKK